MTTDGDPDAVPTSVPVWEYVSGAAGQDHHTYSVETRIDPLPALEGVYVDDDTPKFEECWGDGAFRGAAGAAFTTPIANTDPRSTLFEIFRAHQTSAFWLRGVSLDSWAPAWAAKAQQPLDAVVSPH